MHARARAVGLAKPLEDGRQDVGRDPLPRVAHHDLDVRVDALQAHLDPSALRRELHGVHQQVPDDLLEPVGVAGDRPGPRVEHALDPDGLGLGGRPHGVHGGLDDLLEVDRADVEPHLARDDARDVEQVVDQLDLGVGIALDGLQGPGQLRLAPDLSGAHHARPAVHRVQRRAQLVREHGEELLLRAVGRLGGGARLALPVEQLLAVRLASRVLLGGRHQRGRHLPDLLDRRLRRAARRPRAWAAARRSAIGRLMLRATPMTATIPRAIEIVTPPP